MPASQPKTPAYRLFRPKGLAVVTLNGRDVYLGKYGSPESRAEYDRLIAQWLANGRQLPVAVERRDLTINELILAYLRFADGYYLKNGQPTKEPVNIRLAMRPLRQLYGHTPARDFGPLALKTVREAFLAADLCRGEVNKRVRHIQRAFKWAVAEELVPPSTHHRLQAVTGLRRGRSAARESEPVKPVPEAFVDAIQPYVSRQVWAMIELQRLTGMRPGEVCIMRTADLETGGAIWCYRPTTHKTEHHGHERRVYLGPQAQAVLRPWLRADLSAFLFAPAEAEAERSALRRQQRKTPVQPSQQNRAKPRRAKPPGASYTVDSYRRAIEYGIRKANQIRAERGEPEVPHWHPHQLRHNAATRLRREIGLDAARAVLGHASADVTEIYAERDAAVAVHAMSALG